MGSDGRGPLKQAQSGPLGCEQTPSPRAAPEWSQLESTHAGPSQ